VPIGACPVEPADDGGVDVPHLVRSVPSTIAMPCRGSFAGTGFEYSIYLWNPS
jgi:hypothetical protein